MIKNPLLEIAGINCCLNFLYKMNEQIKKEEV